MAALGCVGLDGCSFVIYLPRCKAGLLAVGCRFSTKNRILFVLPARQFPAWVYRCTIRALPSPPVSIYRLHWNLLPQRVKCRDKIPLDTVLSSAHILDRSDIPHALLPPDCLAPTTEIGIKTITACSRGFPSTVIFPCTPNFFSESPVRKYITAATQEINPIAAIKYACFGIPSLRSITLCWATVIPAANDFKMSGDVVSTMNLTDPSTNVKFAPPE